MLCCLARTHIHMHTHTDDYMSRFIPAYVSCFFYFGICELDFF